MLPENQPEFINPLLSVEDSHVRISVLQENAQELSKEQNLRCLGNSTESLMNLNPNGCSLRMFPNCVRAGCPLSSATLPQLGMMRNGTLFLPQQQVQLIEGKERLLFPTPVAVDCKGESKGCSRHLHKDMVRRICLREFYLIVGKETVYPHPEFVERLMGFPVMWTELNALEIQLSHSKSTRSSKRLPISKEVSKC